MSPRRRVIPACAIALAVAANAAAAPPRPGPPATRLAPGLPGVTVALADTPADVLAKRLKLQISDIGTVAEDPQTGLRILQRRQWDTRMGLLLLEHRIVNGGRKALRIKSIAVPDLWYRPGGRGNAAAGTLPVPTVHALGANFALIHRTLLPDTPLVLPPTRVCPMFVIADGRDAAGVAIAVADDQKWRFRARLTPDGRLRVGIVLQLPPSVLRVPAGESLDLPAAGMTAYRGKWSQGAQALRRIWAESGSHSSWRGLAERLRERFGRTAADKTPARMRTLLGSAHFFLPGSMLPCRPPRPAAGAAEATELQTALRSYLGGAWITGEAPRGLSPAAAGAWARAVRQHGRISPLLEKRYYRPLAVPRSRKDWDAMQFHRVEDHSGVVLVFRQRSAKPSQRLRLEGLRAAGRYRVFDSDGSKQMLLTGRQLNEKGLEVSLPIEGSAVLYYRLALGRVGVLRGPATRRAP